MPVDVVLDDDPTGVQAVRDVPVLLDFAVDRIRRAGASGARAVHLMTNVRALPPAEAETATLAAARAARTALPEARLVLRGDSTLRGHVGEEYRAVCAALGDEPPPVLLLVPALPAAGRVTIGGVHRLRDGHRLVPLDETEYATDGCFAYRSARLLEWAQERTGGALAAVDGTEVALEQLRADGAGGVCAALERAAESGRPAACAPDAETLADLERIAAGLVEAERRGVPVLVRCAPAFAGVLSGTLADGLVPPPAVDERGLLVICGSYVSSTTRQLEHLRAQLDVEPIEPDVARLAGDDAADEVARAARLARHALDAEGLAVVSTPRERAPELTGLDAGERIARGLAAVAAALDPAPGAVIAKGGITSHVVVREGLGASEARAVGPVAPGVALWELESRGRPVAYLVFPGNVGGPELLTDVVRLIRGA